MIAFEPTKGRMVVTIVNLAISSDLHGSAGSGTDPD